MSTKISNLNRRAFVRKSAKATALLSIFPSFSLLANEHAKKIRLVDGGDWGKSSVRLGNKYPYAEFVEMASLH